MNDKKWQDYVRLAKHYRAVGQTDVYLSREEGAPWHLVTEIDADGGLMRKGISVAVTFKAKHPKTGMSFRWCLDIETRNANGASKFMVDVPKLRAVKSVLSAAMSKKFAAIIAEKAKAVRGCGDEYNAIAAEQFGMAHQLETL